MYKKKKMRPKKGYYKIKKIKAKYPKKYPKLVKKKYKAPKKQPMKARMNSFRTKDTNKEQSVGPKKQSILKKASKRESPFRSREA